MVANKNKRARKSNGGNNKVADKPICCYGDLCRNTKTIDRAHGFTAQCHFCDGYFHMYGCGNTETCKKCNPSQKSLYCITNDDAVVDEVPVNRGSNVEGVAGNKGKYLCCMFLLRIDFYLFATMNCVAFFFFHFKGHLRMDF